MVFSPGQTVENTKANMSMIRKKATEFSISRTEEFTKVNG